MHNKMVQVTFNTFITNLTFTIRTKLPQ